jgi:hypothetical protein
MRGVRLIRFSDSLNQARLDYFISLDHTKGTLDHTAPIMMRSTRYCIADVSHAVVLLR